MARITPECEARIKESANIVDLVGRYVQLRRSGYSWKACCPFHNEKTPSFHVNPARQSFHCFGCGVGGDAIKFLMMYENLDYPTALRRLADINGVPVIEEEDDPEIARKRRLRSAVVQVNELAAEYYHKLLCRGKTATKVREYLKERGIDIRIAKAWQLGWAPPDFRELVDLVHSRGFDDRILQEAYLIGKSPRGFYPVFRDRLMFPIRNVRGEIVGFSGRVMQPDGDPRKYVNTSETVAFHKGELLFGLHKATAAIAKADSTALICEGQLDVIACHERADLRYAVAGLGTAFTDDHARLLAKYARKAVLCYDGDNAGNSAAEKTYRKLAAAGVSVYRAVLPAGEDPDSLTRKNGGQSLQQAVKEALPFLEQYVSMEMAACRDDAPSRAALVEQMADLAAEIHSSVQRDIATADLATRLGVGLDRMRESVNQAIQEHRRRPAHVSSDYQGDYTTGDQLESEMSETNTSPAIRQKKAPMITLHPVIRAILNLMFSNAKAHRMLMERVEDLQGPIRYLPGGPLLQKILELAPASDTRLDIEALAQKLPEEEALVLRKVPICDLRDQLMENYVDEVCAQAMNATLEAQIDLLRTRLRSDLSQEEYKSTIEKINILTTIANKK